MNIRPPTKAVCEAMMKYLGEGFYMDYSQLDKVHPRFMLKTDNDVQLSLRISATSNEELIIYANISYPTINGWERLGATKFFSHKMFQKENGFRHDLYLCNKAGDILWRVMLDELDRVIEYAKIRAKDIEKVTPEGIVWKETNTAHKDCTEIHMTMEGAIAPNHFWLINELLVWVKAVSSHGMYAKWFFLEDIGNDKPIEVKVVSTDTCLKLISNGITVEFTYNSYTVKLSMATDDFKWDTTYQWATRDAHPSCWPKLREFRTLYGNHLANKVSTRKLFGNKV